MMDWPPLLTLPCRSRKGAWIEILTSLGLEVVDR